MSVGKFLQAWLTGEAGVASLVTANGTVRIAPKSAPQGWPALAAGAPRVLYDVLGSTPYGTLTGPTSTATYRVQVSLWAAGESRKAEAQALALAVKGTKLAPKLNGFRGTRAGVWCQCSRLVDESDDEEPPVDASQAGPYRVIQDYMLTIEE